MIGERFEILALGTRTTLFSLVDRIRDGCWPISEFSEWDAQKLEEAAEAIRRGIRLEKEKE